MTCSFDGCDRRPHAFGLCSAHYGQRYKGKELTTLRHVNVGKECVFESCGRKAKTRSYCSAHYHQHRMGTGLRPIGPQPWTAERLLTESTSHGECLLFGTHQVTKYPQVRYRGGNISAHRLVYSEFNGDIPPGAHIHHKCGNSNCIKPEHLQLASAAENTLEMLARKSYEARIEALEARVKELESRLDIEPDVVMIG